MTTKKIRRIEYEDGSETVFGYYANGRKEFKLNYNSNGKHEGKQYRWYPNGKKTYELNFKDGILISDKDGNKVKT